MLTAADALDAILIEARKRPMREPRYGFSDALGCMRAACYAFRLHDAGKPMPITQSPVRWNMASWAGDAVGAKLEAAAQRLGLQTQVPVSLPNPHGLEIVGTADLVGPDFVADFKYVGDSAWRDIQKAPKESHWTQVCTYAVALKKPIAALYYVRNVGKGEVPPCKVWHGAAEQDLAEIVILRWKAVDGHRKAGTLPDREFQEGSFQCRTCAFASECRPTEVEHGQ